MYQNPHLFWRKLVLASPLLVVSSLLIFGVLLGIRQSLGLIPSLGLDHLTWDYLIATFENPQVLKAIGFSLGIAFCSATLSLLLGLAISYLLLSMRNPRPLLRLIQLPIIIPHLIVALCISLLLTQSGLLARLGFALGWENAGQFFASMIHDSEGKGIILAYLWKEIPFVIFFTYAILRQTNQHLGWAAQTLGASPLQAFRYIILPLCKRTCYAAYLIIFMYALGAYELPALLGPTLPRALPVEAYVAYTHPDLRHRPYAMAINSVILLIALICAGIYARLIFKQERRESHAS